MAHAERCPVCNGKGVVPFNFYDIQPATNNFPYETTTAGTVSTQPCRACGGKGYVEVSDSNGTWKVKPTWTGDWEYTNEEGPTLGNTSDHTS